MTSKLGEAEADLGIDDASVSQIRKKTIRRKLLSRAFNLLAPLLSFVGGFALAGGLTRPAESDGTSYPYVAAAVPIFNYRSLSRKTKVTALGTVAVSVIAFAVGYVLGDDILEPNDRITTLYGVFRTGESSHA